MKATGTTPLKRSSINAEKLAIIAAFRIAAANVYKFHGDKYCLLLYKTLFLILTRISTNYIYDLLFRIRFQYVQLIS